MGNNCQDCAWFDRVVADNVGHCINDLSEYFESYVEEYCSCDNWEAVE